VTDPLAPAETRIDRWLTAVRLVKTRPLATRLCEGGHVRVNGSPAKPSTIESRVGAAVAVTCYLDHSPPPVVTELRPGIMAVRGEGRPSKRLRRELERLRRAGGR